MAGLLWGESPEAEARASLRQTLRAIRASFGDVIRADRFHAELGEAPHCDVTEFRLSLTQEPSKALDSAIPRFMTGFSVRHAPQFEEWVAEVRTSLLHDYHAALATVAREAMAQRKWRTASAAAERWIASDPLSEEAAHLAVESLYLAGNRGGALARAVAYRDALYRETGCEPGRGFGALMQRVKVDRASSESQTPHDGWDAPGLSLEASLTGRESEWTKLTDAWSAVRRGGRTNHSPPG